MLALIVRSVLAFCLTGSLVSAEEKKPEPDKKPEPPRVTLVSPLGVAAGSTNIVKIRGVNLTNSPTLQFPSLQAPPEINIKSVGKVEVPKEMEAKKVGDTQIELELKLPSPTPAGPLPFVIVTPEGRSPTNTIEVIDAAQWVEEREPNDGFRKPQNIRLPATISGGIQGANDVDVFRFEGRAGEQLIAEVHAASRGSSLDSVLTLYDERGHVLAVNDDSSTGRDSTLHVKLPRDGVYFLGLIDAHDKGGVTHVYLLKGRLER